MQILHSSYFSDTTSKYRTVLISVTFDKLMLLCTYRVDIFYSMAVHKISFGQPQCTLLTAARPKSREHFCTYTSRLF